MSDTSAFFQAIKEGNDDAVQSELARNPALLQARAEGGETPVLLAAYYGQQEVVKALFQAGHRANLYEAAAMGNLTSLYENIASEPGNINAFSDDGFTALQLAAYFGRGEIVEVLLEEGADVSPVSRHPMQVTAIHAAVASGNPRFRVPIARALLDHGADVNAKHPGGYTPLHAAAQNGDLELARLLLDHGAIPNAITDEGKTPLDMARENGHNQVAGLLQSASGIAD